MCNPFAYLLLKTRLWLATKRTKAAKKVMEDSIRNTRLATADIDGSYADFLEKAKEQEAAAVALRRLQRKQSVNPILSVYVDTGTVTVTDSAQAELTKLDTELALTRHRLGDWGKADVYRWCQNNQAALSFKGFIRSAYTCFGNKRFCIHTDYDTYTTRICMEDELWG